MVYVPVKKPTVGTVVTYTDYPMGDSPSARLITGRVITVGVQLATIKNEQTGEWFGLDFVNITNWKEVV